MLRKLWILFSLPLFLITSCTKEAPAPEEKKPLALVSISPYAPFIEKLSGGKLDARPLIPSTANIHTWEPTPREVEEAMKATVWFQIGEPIEKRLTTVFLEKNPTMKIVSLQEGLPLIEGDALDLSPTCSHNHGHGYDLHTWMSPRLMAKQVSRIAQVLGEMFPKQAKTLKKNQTAIIKSLVALDESTKKTLSSYSGDALLASHPAFGYFCRDYGLVQLAVECEGKNPKPYDLEILIDRASKYPIRAVILQKGFDNRGARLIGKLLNIPVVEINPFSDDYEAMIQSLTQAIVE